MFLLQIPKYVNYFILFFWRMKICELVELQCYQLIISNIFLFRLGSNSMNLVWADNGSQKEKMCGLKMDGPMGQNGPIPQFLEIFSKKTLFRK